MSKVRIRLNRAGIAYLQATTTEKLARNAANAVQARARRNAPKQSGRLAASINVTMVLAGPVTRFRIGSDLHYAKYQEFGTGPITPNSPGGVLVFKVGGQTVFTRRTRGVPATYFMTKTARTITARDFL